MPKVKKEEWLPVIFPTDEVIQNQLKNLENLEMDMQSFDEVRSKVIFWPKNLGPKPNSKPNLRLIKD